MKRYGGWYWYTTEKMNLLENIVWKMDVFSL